MLYRPIPVLVSAAGLLFGAGCASEDREDERGDAGPDTTTGSSDVAVMTEDVSDTAHVDVADEGASDTAGLRDGDGAELDAVEVDAVDEPDAYLADVYDEDGSEPYYGYDGGEMCFLDCFAFIYCRDGEVSYYPTTHFWDGYCEDAWLYECPEALTFECPSGECQEGWVDIDTRDIPAEVAAGAPRFCAP